MNARQRRKLRRKWERAEEQPITFSWATFLEGMRRRWKRDDRRWRARSSHRRGCRCGACTGIPF